MENVINIILVTLGVFRLSYMVSNEDGPGDIFSKLREWVGQSNWVGRGLNCFLCVSFWVSSFGAFFLYPDDSKMFFTSWFAIAGLCLIIHKRLTQR